MGKPRLILYVDLVSPFAYLAFHVIRNDPTFENVEISYVPCFLAGIMKATGNTAPINIKNKATWIGKERLRWAARFNVPMHEQMPPGFPQNTVQAGRALIAVSLVRPERLPDVIAAAYSASFERREEMHKLEHMETLLVTILGEEAAEQVMEKATSDEVKQILAKNTEHAVANGCFGLPWFVATNANGLTESFWGFDHIAQVADHLGLNRPLPASPEAPAWRALL